MLILVSSIKLVVEIALMALIGQFLLGLLIGRKRDDNMFYGVLEVLTRPFVKLARLGTPRLVLDRHVPLAAFLLLAVIWVAVTAYKIKLCVELGVQACR
ncbi:MAG: hypothetical protein H0T52_08135 [Lautropia sp.]|nr:hypothetical protein [Lautropia sp.]